MPSYFEVKTYLQSKGFEPLEFEQITPDAVTSAQTIGCSVAEIAKTLLVKVGTTPVVVIASGDMKVNSSQLKRQSGLSGKVTFPKAEEVERETGYRPGGVSPFLLPEHLPVFVDTSLRQFGEFFPAAGNDRSAVKMTWSRLLELTGGRPVEICRPAK